MQNLDIMNLEAVVCATLLDRPNLIDDIRLSYTDFVDEQFSLIYRTIEWLAQNGKPITNVILIDKLKNRVDEEHILEVIDATHSQPWAIEQHSRIIRENSCKKRMMRFAQNLIGLSQSGADVDEIMAEAEKSWDEIRSTNDTSEHELRLIADLLPKYEQRMDDRIKAFRSGGKLTGINTGFENLDKLTFGYQPTYLYIIGARPSMGKTAFSLQSAVGASEKDFAAIFTIEMDDISILDRIMSSTSQIKMSRISLGAISDDQMGNYSGALERLRKSNIAIDDNSSVTIQYLRSRIRRIKRKMPQDRRLVVFVDYLQIMETTKGRSRTEEVSNISRDLKRIAKECDCAVVALVQLSRSVEQRADKHPMLSDIRESGQIEQDADCIMFLYRDDYYNAESKLANILEVIVAKQRNGKTGTVQTQFKKEFQQLCDVTIGLEANRHA